MKLKLKYYYDPEINNSRICVAFDEAGVEIARGHHSTLFTEAKWVALREAQRVLTVKPITVPEIEFVDVNWGLNE